MNLKFAIFKPMLKLAMERTGHGAALGFEITKVEKGEVELLFPYQVEVVGNPLTGVIHGGVIVSLLDTCCGSAAITILDSRVVTPTMDLRLDYMHPAEPFQPVYVSAKVYKHTANVIFCRGSAWQGDRDNPIAHCVATFMKVETSSISLSSVMTRQIKRLFRSKSAHLVKEDE
jgi:uncharacterized protein (TIGR00369 family)